MTTTAEKVNVFVDATALLPARPSGIGHTVRSIVEELMNTTEFADSYQLVLVAPFDRLKILRHRGLPAGVRVKALPLSYAVSRVLNKAGWLPPMDVLCGNGVYMFPNYENWPLLRNPSVTYIYDLCFEVCPQFVEPRNRSYLVRRVPGWIRRTDRVVCLTHQVRREIEEAHPEAADKTVVIPNGVDTNTFKPLDRAKRDAVIAKYQLSGKYFMFLSNIEPRKDIPTLLDAYVSLPQTTRETHGLLLVGGMGWLNEAIVERIRNLQQQGYAIHWPEQYVPDSDLPALLGGATALVHPAVYEGFGMSPLQAMACGTPVIAADIPAVREVVGSHALLFPQGDSLALAEHMKRVMRSAPGVVRMTQEARARATELSWGATAQALLKCINELKPDVSYNKKRS